MMFDSFKKTRTAKKERENNIKHLEQQGINPNHFKLFLKAKNLNINDITPELIQEYNNRENYIEKLAISCRLTLPEMYTDVNNALGAATGLITGHEHNFTNTTREQIRVNTSAVIVPKGIVFKGAINNTQDLRIPWEDITSCKIGIKNKFGISADIQAKDVKYPILFTNRKLGECFLNYVSDHMAGNVDDGWS